MDGIIVGAVIFAAFAAAVAVGMHFGMTDKQKRDAAYGPLNIQMRCPHCQALGRVRTKKVLRDAGLSGDKLFFALATCGLSLLFLGANKSELRTQAHCSNCGNVWNL